MANKTEHNTTAAILTELRKKRSLTQEELANLVFVTRQAVSRWEQGETVPSTETLKLLSREFGVSINTLLGSPEQLQCQCCGMPLEDGVMARKPDGSLNEEYCQWCYVDGEFVYNDMEELIDYLAEHMATEAFPAEQLREFCRQEMPKLKHWRELAQAQNA